MVASRRGQSYHLYGAARSAASYRVRIALNLKQIPFAETLVDLASGEHLEERFRGINPQGFVPALITPDGDVLTQSLAIIDFLEEAHPQIALLPANAAERARVRSLAQIIACDIHPVNNMRVRNHIRTLLPADPDAVPNWLEKWSAAGFQALETRLSKEPATGLFCHGDKPGLADACLMPQAYNATLTGFDLEPYPRVREIVAACAPLPAFQASHLDRIGV